MKPEIYNRS